MDYITNQILTKMSNKKDEKKHYKGNAVYQPELSRTEVYRNYLNWIDSYANGYEYIEPDKFRDTNYIKRPEGFKTKSLVMRTMYDYLLLTYRVNKKIDLTDLIDDILTEFFSKVPSRDLEPLSEKEFFSQAKKYGGVRNLRKKAKV